MEVKWIALSIAIMVTSGAGCQAVSVVARNDLRQERSMWKMYKSQSESYQAESEFYRKESEFYKSKCREKNNG